MRRSAAVLERLAGQLPYSALALCRLVRPHAASGRHGHPPALPPRTAPKAIDYTSSSSTIPVDVSAHSLDSPAALSEFDGGGSGSGSSITGLGSLQHQHQHQQTTTTTPEAVHAPDFPVNGKLEKASRASSAGPRRASSPPPPPPRPAAAIFGASRHSNPFSSPSAARPPIAGPGAGAGAFFPVLGAVAGGAGGAAAGAAAPAPLVDPWAETGAVAEEVAVQEWAVTGSDDHGGGVGEI